MTVTLVSVHTPTKGPEKHQTWIFNLESDSPGGIHGSSVFTYENEEYRAINTHAHVAPVVKDGKKYPVHQVRAVKCSDESVWLLKGRQGEPDRDTKAKLAEYDANRGVFR